MKFKIFILFILASYFEATACSMYKITLHGKTFVGNNEDYLNPNTRIWFEKGNVIAYGSVFVGLDNFFPQLGKTMEAAVDRNTAIAKTVTNYLYPKGA